MSSSASEKQQQLQKMWIILFIAAVSCCSTYWVDRRLKQNEILMKISKHWWYLILVKQRGNKENQYLSNLFPNCIRLFILLFVNLVARHHEFGWNLANCRQSWLDFVCYIMLHSSAIGNLKSGTLKSAAKQRFIFMLLHSNREDNQ